MSQLSVPATKTVKPLYFTLRFIAVIVGFVMVASKAGVLVPVGGVLLFAGIFTPVFENLLGPRSSQHMGQSLMAEEKTSVSGVVGATSVTEQPSATLAAENSGINEQEMLAKSVQELRGSIAELCIALASESNEVIGPVNRSSGGFIGTPEQTAAYEEARHARVPIEPSDPSGSTALLERSAEEKRFGVQANFLGNENIPWLAMVDDAVSQVRAELANSWGKEGGMVSHIGFFIPRINSRVEAKYFQQKLKFAFPEAIIDQIPSNMATAESDSLRHSTDRAYELTLLVTSVPKAASHTTLSSTGRSLGTIRPEMAGEIRGEGQRADTVRGRLPEDGTPDYYLSREGVAFDDAATDAAVKAAGRNPQGRNPAETNTRKTQHSSHSSQRQAPALPEKARVEGINSEPLSGDETAKSEPRE